MTFLWKPFQSPKLACATTCRCIHLQPSAAMAPKLSTMKAMKTSMKVAMNSIKATKMESKKDTSKSAMPEDDGTKPLWPLLRLCCSTKGCTSWIWVWRLWVLPHCQVCMTPWRTSFMKNGLEIHQPKPMKTKMPEMKAMKGTKRALPKAMPKMKVQKAMKAQKAMQAMK